MKCSIKDCKGSYEDKLVTKSLRVKGKIIVLDSVPAEICGVCGDVLFKPETMIRIEEILKEGHQPDGSAPIYKYASNS